MTDRYGMSPQRQNLSELSEEDKTPTNSYSIKLSERDIDALQHLKDRNGAGMTVGGGFQNIAIWKIINQVCDLPKVKNIEHPEWLV